MLMHSFLTQKLTINLMQNLMPDHRNPTLLEQTIYTEYTFVAATCMQSIGTEIPVKLTTSCLFPKNPSFIVHDLVVEDSEFWEISGLLPSDAPEIQHTSDLGSCLK